MLYTSFATGHVTQEFQEDTTLIIPISIGRNFLTKFWPQFLQTFPIYIIIIKVL